MFNRILGICTPFWVSREAHSAHLHLLAQRVKQCFRSIVDLPFRIMTCRFLLAIASRTWDLVYINLSFASRDFVCARSTASTQSPRLRMAFGFVHRRGHHTFRESSFCIASARTTLAVFCCECCTGAVGGSVAAPLMNRSLCTHPSTSNMRLDRPQVLYFKSSVWSDQESNPA